MLYQVYYAYFTACYIILHYFKLAYYRSVIAKLVLQQPEAEEFG